MELFGAETTRHSERKITRYREGQGDEVGDLVTVEEPLEIRIDNESVAVIMRTPQNDLELAAGFLLGEGILTSPAAIGAISYCPSAEPPNERNVVEVRLAAGQLFDSAQFKRNFYATASCGICGKASIEAITQQVPQLQSDIRLTPDLLYALPEKMLQAQAVFEQTGSLHAAALFDVQGELLLLREDVGRHNAVDKLVGAYALRGERVPTDSVLLVSGRTSFEIVQKTLAAGIAVLAAVSAPSSLAVDLAREAGLTLLGFLRGRRFNLYSGEQRILPS